MRAFTAITMINDLLDLSKIEAGRMDVNPERFDVRELVTSACDTVSPLIQEGVELRQDVADDPSTGVGQASLMVNTDQASREGAMADLQVAVQALLDELVESGEEVPKGQGPQDRRKTKFFLKGRRKRR